MILRIQPRSFTPYLAGALAVASLTSGCASAGADAATAGIGGAATTPQSAGAAVPRPGAAGIGDRVHPGLGNGGYDVRRYGLALRFTHDLSAYTATTTLTARARQALSRFDLDLNGPRVRSVTVDGRRAAWSTSGQELRVTPRRPLPAGREFTVRVTVRGTVATPRQARRLGTSAVGLIRAQGFVQSINQPSGAHRIAALADHPAQKAPATITITAPSKVNSIANGRLTGTRHAGGSTTRRFTSGEKLAPELIQIGLGRFSVVHRRGPGGIHLRYAVPTGKRKALMPQIDRVVPSAIGWFTRRLGPFPLRTYGIYATPLGGELETQSLTLLATSELTKSGMRHNGSDSIVTHEISHEYFGNSVSPRRWRDLWLNEGHAVYYESLWSAAKHGSDAAKRFKSAYQDSGAQLRRQGPVAAPRPGAFKPRSMAPYGFGAYQGGALTLYALRQKVGAATFQRIERAWVSEHRNNTAGTGDYIRLASRVSGQNLRPFLRSWLYSTKLPSMPGHPNWKVKETK